MPPPGQGFGVRILGAITPTVRVPTPSAGSESSRGTERCARRCPEKNGAVDSISQSRELGPRRSRLDGRDEVGDRQLVVGEGFLRHRNVVAEQLVTHELETGRQLGAGIAHLLGTGWKRKPLERGAGPASELGNVHHLPDVVVVVQPDPRARRATRDAIRRRSDPGRTSECRSNTSRRRRHRSETATAPRRQTCSGRRAPESRHAASPSTGRPPQPCSRARRARPTTCRCRTRYRGRCRCAPHRRDRGCVRACAGGGTDGRARTPLPRRSRRTDYSVASRSASFHVRNRDCTFPSGPAPSPDPSGNKRNV